MNSLYRITCLGLLIIWGIPALHAQPNIWTVNPDPAAGADFEDLQQAIDNADAGDIIHVAGNNDRNHDFAYWNIQIDKRLMLYGTGYWLAENGVAATEGTLSSKIMDLQINGGAEGTLISGFTLERVSVTGVSGSVTFKGNLFCK